MKKNYLFQLILFILFSTNIIAQPISATFNASGTYTVPAGYSAIVTIEVWGAGGGGAAAASGGKGGGGGGACSVISTTLPAGSYIVTVGTGGGAGGNGGNSSFTSISVAAGGKGAVGLAGGAGGTTAAGTGTTKFAGGNGAASVSNSGGGGGGSATASANGGNAGGITGGTGQGNGGTGGIPNNNPGTSGVSPGGGGGGTAGPGTGSASGSGAVGQVKVTVTSVLSIKISYINGSRNNGFNTINWLAACTSTQAIFEIERSADGRNFNAIHSITASQARCAQPFTYVDNTNLSGNVFYRIKSIDIDGRFNYSSTVKLGSRQKDMQLEAVIPNPVSDQAQLSISAAKNDKLQLSIISMDGKLQQRSIVQLQSGSSIISLDVAHLQKGMYIIKGVFSDGQTRSLKFLKQ